MGRKAVGWLKEIPGLFAKSTSPNPDRQKLMDESTKHEVQSDGLMIGSEHKPKKNNKKQGTWVNGRISTRD